VRETAGNLPTNFEYGSIVKRTRPGGARARDFLDIYTIVVERQIDMCSEENRRLLSRVFDAKRVPVSLLDALPKYREFHRRDFPAVQATVKAGFKIRDFDFYFDFVADLVSKIRT
jgi:hypothetical protein